MADNNSTFKSYDEYMKNVFDCVNRCLASYLEDMKGTFSNGQGGYKSPQRNRLRKRSRQKNSLQKNKEKRIRS